MSTADARLSVPLVMRRTQGHGTGVIVQKFDRSVQLILAAALFSMFFSIYLWFFEDKDAGVFVGIWVPSILGFGALMRSPR